MAVINAQHLKEWAATQADARNLLGELIGRLIKSQIAFPDIRFLRFPSAGSTNLADWDGQLWNESQAENRFIPKRFSVWEFGAGAGGPQKIRGDFSKRENHPLRDGWARNETTYIAVVPQGVADPNGIEKELKAKGIWKDVRVYDAVMLSEWVSTSVDVEVWLQEMQVGPQSSVRSLKRAWDDWAAVTVPNISTEAVLAGRDEQAAKLQRDIVAEGNVLDLRADSPEEAIAFVDAALALEEDALKSARQRAVVVSTQRDAQRVAQSGAPIVAVLSGEATILANVLSRARHTVVVVHGNSATTPDKGGAIRLSRPDGYTFAARLQSMGVTEADCLRDARACGRSLSVWRIWQGLDRSHWSDTQLPAWATAPHHVSTMASLVLLGAWSEKSPGDTAIVAQVSGEEFKTYRKGLHDLKLLDDPPVQQVGDLWAVSAPATAFALLVRHIDSDLLERFAMAVATAFGTVSPIVDLKADERPYAALRDVKPPYSKYLLDGLAESLVLIAVLGGPLEQLGSIPDGVTREDFVARILAGVPKLGQDRRVLQSLERQLPMLAEAAPGPLLNALECLLQGGSEVFLPLFDEGDGITGHASHPALWWALETISWDTTSFPRVVSILGQFASIDPGGRLNNRPLKSLWELFLPWRAQTNLTQSELLSTLDALIARQPDIAWRLLRSLVPSQHHTSFGVRQPEWREPVPPRLHEPSDQEIYESYVALGDRTIALASHDVDRLSSLIEHFSHLSQKHQDLLVEGLEDVSADHPDEDQRAKVFDALRRLIAHHRQFPQAGWAMAEATITRLEALAERFAPQDDVERIVWLFDDYFPDLPSPRDQSDPSAIEQELMRARRNAIDGLIASRGTDGIPELVRRAKYAFFGAPDVVRHLAGVSEARTFARTFDLRDVREAGFMRALSAAALDRFGQPWIDLLTMDFEAGAIPTEEMANLLLGFPYTASTLDLVETLPEPVSKCFWEQRSGFGGEKDLQQRTIAAYVKYGRIWDAIDIAGMHPNLLNVPTALSLLDSATQLTPDSQRKPSPYVAHWIRALFKWLRTTTVDSKEIARREYQYLPLLTTGARGETELALHRTLSEEPEFFVDVLCDLYRPAKARDTDVPEAEKNLTPEDLEIRKTRAKFAWTLLRSWKRPPGLSADGKTLDEPKFSRWVAEARTLAASRDRRAIADQQIGAVVEHVPDDPTDGAWPHRALREVLEQLDSDDIGRGISIEVVNDRGVTSRALYEGGSQERVLRDFWLARAEAMRGSWPRTQALLRAIAENWEHQAKHEDAAAEKDKLRFS